jgi:hypothetical protein
MIIREDKICSVKPIYFLHMKKYLIKAFLLFSVNYAVFAQVNDWHVNRDKILTQWAESVDPLNVLPEYPRPQMVRENWKNLNGLWEYSIVSKASQQPATFDGKILVPFAAESALSGVARSVSKENNLWYKTSFEFSPSMKKKTILLHFGAVDWETEVFVNGQSVGTHQGGYDPFTFDIVKTKEMGFNMIRKHVKVEPARWYYYCDVLGMLVWQDMPSGDLGARWEPRPGVAGIGHDMDRSPESERIYRMEWEAIMSTLHNFPSIVVWVPFNEAWWQFKTKEIVGWTAKMDPSRLVNEASGGNFHFSGDIIDLHNYPDAAMPKPEIFGQKQIVVLGEFGGLGLPVAEHTWQEKDNWGYRNFKDADELKQRYERLMDGLRPLISKGLSAAVYTQTTDVEVEVNGLMTYDRKITKMPESFLKALHQKLYEEEVVFE